jgi:hypothetical protein
MIRASGSRGRNARDNVTGPHDSSHEASYRDVVFIAPGKQGGPARTRELTVNGVSSEGRVTGHRLEPPGDGPEEPGGLRYSTGAVRASPARHGRQHRSGRPFL